MDKKDPQRGTIHLLMTTMRLLKNMLEQITGNIGWHHTHHTQHRVLFYLVDQHGSPSQREIADFLKISPAAVTATLKKMEENGLIEKSVNKKDIRINQVNITSKGYELTQTAKFVFKATDDALLKGFDQADLEGFMAYLERMQHNIATMDTEQIIKKGKEMIKHEALDEIY